MLKNIAGYLSGLDSAAEEPKTSINTTTTTSKNYNSIFSGVGTNNTKKFL